jgi:hypothetical protein
MADDSKTLKEYTCPVCGKIFVPAPYHRYCFWYQGVKIICCRWNCYVKAQRAKEEAEQKNYDEAVRKRKLIHEQKKKESMNNADTRNNIGTPKE